MNMRFSKILGVIIVTFSVSFSIFYIFWFFGLLPIDPELAVKIPVLIIVLGVCFIASWVGYIMITAPGPFSEKE
ncbi:MAG: hypothetical protein QW655_03100 [Nitrososphaerota archaeon]|nr:hypothetical protein [Candidatus Geocrenenecus dongiae]